MAILDRSFPRFGFEGLVALMFGWLFYCVCDWIRAFRGVFGFCFIDWYCGASSGW